MKLEVKLLLIAVWLTPAYQRDICRICSPSWSTWLKSQLDRAGLTPPGVSDGAAIKQRFKTEPGALILRLTREAKLNFCLIGIL